jgi:hypothetical protein
MAPRRRDPKDGKLALLSAPFVTDALTATLAGVAVERSVNLDAIPIVRNSPSIAREAENADRRRLPWNLLQFLPSAAGGTSLCSQPSRGAQCVGDGRSLWEIDGPQVLVLQRGVGNYAPLCICFTHRWPSLWLGACACDERVHQRGGGLSERVLEEQG